MFERANVMRDCAFDGCDDLAHNIHDMFLSRRGGRLDQSTYLHASTFPGDASKVTWVNTNFALAAE
jgi:hypothetical protein